MVRTTSRLGADAGRYLLVATLTGLLVGCGGSSGDANPFDQEDLDGDGTVNIEDADSDNDGIDDLEDNFIDWDEDGFDDISGLTQAEADALDNPDDADNDGFTDVSATNVCGDEAGLDNNSSNNAWNDNCVVKRSTSNGQFADSLFSVGIQRVLFCKGFYPNTDDNSDYRAFADGEYGPGSETAMIAFQTQEGLEADGIVGPQSWARLQAQLELLAAGTFGSVPDTYGFTEGPCAGTPMFYQDTAQAADGISIDRGQWTLPRNTPNEADAVPFSYESPFGRL